MIERVTKIKEPCEEIIHAALQTEGVYVAAIGAPACLRVLYFRARDVGCTNKIHFIPLKDVDIVLNKGPELLQRKLEEMCNQKSYEIRGIVIYLSCMDIILYEDYTEAKDYIQKKYDIPVHIFRRGPLIKRSEKPKENLGRILQDIQESKHFYGGGISQKSSLPEIASDYSGAISIVYPTKGASILLTPGGCIHNITEVDEGREMKRTNLFFTRYNDLDLSQGLESILTDAVSNIPADCPFIFLIGTQTTYITGVSIKSIAEVLERKSIVPVIPINTNGFESFEKGIEMAVLNLLEKFCEENHDKRPRVNIFGYNPLEFFSESLLDDLLDFFTELGIEVNLPEHSGIEAYKSAAESMFTLCLSEASAKSGEYLLDKFSIPFDVGYPIGITRTLELMRKLSSVENGVLAGESFRKCFEEYLQERDNIEKELYAEKTVILLGGTELHHDISDCLKQDFGIDAEQLSFTEGKSVKNGSSALYIGDPIYVHLNSENFIKLPYGGLSGRGANIGEVHLLGKEGYQFLKNYLD